MNRILIIIFAAVCAAGCSTSAPRPNAVPDLRPFVRQMLESPTQKPVRDKEKSPFFKALAELARLQDRNPEDYLTYRSKGKTGGASGPIIKGRAVEIHSGGKTYVIAVLGSPGKSGTPSAQQLVLISPDGRILDKLLCNINSRYGGIHTETRIPSDPDEAQMVIIFEPGQLNSSGWHNWHRITCAGKTYDFREDEKKQPSVWDEKGLCRIKIADGRFVVLFPELKEK